MDEGTSTARRPRRRRWYVVGGVTVVSAVLAAGLGFGVSGATSGVQTANATTSTTTTRPPYCTVGMTTWKCEQEMQAAASPATTAPPKTVPITHAEPTECGPTFFSATTRAALTQHFGMDAGCFRPQGSDQWVLVMSDMSVGTGGTPPPSAPGGAIVALFDCTAGDTACLDANTTHTFSAFTVYYMPYPEITRADLVLTPHTPSTHFIVVTDCGQDGFDLLTHQWYLDLKTTQKQELTAGVTLPTLPAPAPVSGAQALASSAPAAAPGVNTDC
jgi:hypothetical protein